MNISKGILEMTRKSSSVNANTMILPKAALGSFLWSSINGSFISQFSNGEMWNNSTLVILTPYWEDKLTIVLYIEIVVTWIIEESYI